MSEKSFSLEIIHSELDVSTESIDALVEVLRGRGHVVRVRRPVEDSLGVRDLGKSVKEIAETTKELASQGVQALVKGVRGVIGQKVGGEQLDAVLVSRPELWERGEDREVLGLGLISQAALEHRWESGGVHGMVVSHPSIVSYLKSVSWDEKALFLGGYIVCEGYQRQGERQALKAKYGAVEGEGPVVLVMAEGFSRSQLQVLVTQLSLMKIDAQLYFYHGDDVEVKGQLRMLSERNHIVAQMFGKVKPYGDTLGFADVVVVSQQSPLLGELESLGMVLCVVGEERQNAAAAFIVNEGSGVYVQQLYQLSSNLEGLLVDDERMLRMQESAKALSLYGSTERCADAIESALSHREELIRKAEEHVQEVHDGFEKIGALGGEKIKKVFEDIGQQSEVKSESGEKVAPLVEAVQKGIHRVMSGIRFDSKKDAHSAYSRLLMYERDLDKQVDKASEEVQKWERRLDVARQNGDEQLVAEAQKALEGAMAEEVALFAQKSELRQEMAEIKEAVKNMKGSTRVVYPIMEDEILPNPDSETEAKFKEMMREHQLKQLKNKMGRED